MGSTQSDFYDTTHHPDAIDGNRNWLTQLNDDNISIASLSIPGTHNSLGLYGGHMYECQSWDLRDQFYAGIRFIDVKCRHMYNSLVVYHGRVHQKKNFDDVIRCALDFLHENPKEFIMMRVKEEHTPLNVSREFHESFRACLEYHGRDKFYTSNAMPNLGQVRKKIIIIGSNSFLRIPTLQQVQPTEFENFKHSYRERWQRLERVFQACKFQAQASDRLYITYCSGFSYASYPYTVAWRINSRLYHYVRNYSNSPFGVVVMDYPGVALISTIIDSNHHRLSRDGSFTSYSSSAAYSTL